jgi:hypothetical protein
MSRLLKWLASLCRPVPACDCPACQRRRAEALAELVRHAARA